MSRYRKKPVEVEAVRYYEPNANLIHHRFPRHVVAHPGYLTVHTLHGIVRAEPGDWIVQGPHGDVWPCKPDIFEATYEEVDPLP